jgi:trehalose 6-phosphate synthase/phosphatase
VNDFLKQLAETKEQQDAQKTRYISERVQQIMIADFRNAAKRHLFLDYDGTLVPFTKHPKLAVPSKQLIDLLIRLSADSKTEVTIVSGRTRDSLEDWFGDLPINLIAEHGAAIRFSNGIWRLDEQIDQSWKPIIKSSLELFTQRSPGSFIEEKNNTLAWHYRNVDPELGFIRSRELLDSLHHMIRNAHLQIIDGNKVIEIRVAGVDKGSVTKKFLQGKNYGFILAVGDDKTDEDMFRALADKAITIKIGSGHTLAQYNLATQREILNLLNLLSQATSGSSQLHPVGNI